MWKTEPHFTWGSCVLSLAPNPSLYPAVEVPGDFRQAGSFTITKHCPSTCAIGVSKSPYIPCLLIDQLQPSTTMSYSLDVAPNLCGDLGTKSYTPLLALSLLAWMQVACQPSGLLPERRNAHGECRPRHYRITTSRQDYM